MSILLQFNVIEKFFNYFQLGNPKHVKLISVNLQFYSQDISQHICIQYAFNMQNLQKCLSYFGLIGRKIVGLIKKFLYACKKLFAFTIRYQNIQYNFLPCLQEQKFKMHFKVVQWFLKLVSILSNVWDHSYIL